MGKSIGQAFKRKVEREEELIATTRPVRSRTSLFMNETRRQIYQYLTFYPCTHLRKIGRQLGFSPPTIRWHLDKLIEVNMVGRQKIGKSLVFYPIGMIEPDDIPIAALLNRTKARRIILIVDRRPGINQQEICDELGVGNQAVRWYATQLEEVGIIESVVDGRYRRYFLTDLIPTKIEEGRKRRKHFRELVLKQLAADGVAPELVRTTEHGIIVRLRTGRTKSTLELAMNPFPTMLAH